MKEEEVRGGTACSPRIGAYVGQGWCLPYKQRLQVQSRRVQSEVLCPSGYQGFGLGSFQNVSETYLPSAEKVGIAGRACQRSSEGWSRNEELE